jgi:hypothetical protein
MVTSPVQYVSSQGGRKLSQRFYTYSSLSVYFTRITGLLWIVISALLLAAVWSDWLSSTPGPMPFSDRAALTAFMLLSVLMSIIVASLYPDLSTSEEGLGVRFGFWTLQVPWEEVLSVRRLLISVRRRPTYLIQVKKLTTIHRFISLSQLGGWRPGFLVSSVLDGYDELMKTIRQHAG